MHFPFCYWCIWRNPSRIPWHPRARFNSKLVLVSAWPICTLWPHSYIHPCFHLTCISCLCLNFESSSLFIHAGILHLLPISHLLGCTIFRPGGRNHLSRIPLLCGACSPCDSSKKIPEKDKVSSPEVLGCYLALPSHNTDLHNLVVTEGSSLCPL